RVGTAIGRDLDVVEVRPVRGVTRELLPARDRPVLQRMFRPDNLEGATFVTIEDRQSETPVPLLGDHPVVHILEPVELALEAERRVPVRLAGLFLELLPQLVHRDVPLVDEAEEQGRAAAPAPRVTVGGLVRSGPSALS